jgi:hypothetical protein
MNTLNPQQKIQKKTGSGPEVFRFPDPARIFLPEKSPKLAGSLGL